MEINLSNFDFYLFKNNLSQISINYGKTPQYIIDDSHWHSPLLNYVRSLVPNSGLRKAPLKHHIKIMKQSKYFYPIYIRAYYNLNDINIRDRLYPYYQFSYDSKTNRIINSNNKIYNSFEFQMCVSSRFYSLLLSYPVDKIFFPSPMKSEQLIVKINGAYHLIVTFEFLPKSKSLIQNIQKDYTLIKKFIPGSHSIVNHDYILTQILQWITRPIEFYELLLNIIPSFDDTILNLNFILKIFFRCGFVWNACTKGIRDNSLLYKTNLWNILAENNFRTSQEQCVLNIILCDNMNTSHTLCDCVLIVKSDYNLIISSFAKSIKVSLKFKNITENNIFTNKNYIHFSTYDEQKEKYILIKSETYYENGRYYLCLDVILIDVKNQSLFICTILNADIHSHLQINSVWHKNKAEMSKFLVEETLSKPEDDTFIFVHGNKRYTTHPSKFRSFNFFKDLLYDNSELYTSKNIYDDHVIQKFIPSYHSHRMVCPKFCRPYKEYTNIMKINLKKKRKINEENLKNIKILLHYDKFSKQIFFTKYEMSKWYISAIHINELSSHVTNDENNITTISSLQKTLKSLLKYANATGVF